MKKSIEMFFGATLILSTTCGQLRAQSVVRKFVPFQKFVAQIQAATSSAFQVKDGANFEEMRQHILTLYQGVDVKHSFVLDSNHFDCIAVEQQPAVRMQGLRNVEQPPPLSAIAHNTRSSNAVDVKSQFDSAQQTDQFGNSAGCEAGTIPMRLRAFDRHCHATRATCPPGAAWSTPNSAPTTPTKQLPRFSDSSSSTNRKRPIGRVWSCCS